MDNTSKLYYSIGEVSELLGVESHVLRYWEAEFPQFAPRKNSAGRRIYTEEDLIFARRIFDLLRVEKYTLEGARQVLERDETKFPHSQTRRGELLNLRHFLENISRQLA